MRFFIRPVRKGKLLNSINFKPFLETLGKSAVDEVEGRFATSRDPNGREWAALKYRSGRPLVDTGRLSRSIRYTVGKDNVTVTTDVPYAGYHQYGTSRIPQRQFMGFSQELITKYKNDLDKFIKARW